MDKKRFEQLAKNLQDITSCPNCGGRYAISDIRYFGQLGMTIFVQLTCHNCHVPVFAGIPSGNKTDERDREVLTSKTPVTYDDVIETHRALADRNLDFQDLFKKL
jgi:hypothetical protein